jgi:hypothetical protein
MHSVFFPVLLLSATYLAWTVFQTTQLLREREALRSVHTTQEKQIEESKKLRASLDKLARETQLLANRGNRNALLIVDELRKRGITINPDASAAPPSPAPANPTR